MKLKKLSKGNVILTPNQSKMYGEIVLLNHQSTPINLVQDVGEGCHPSITPGCWALTDKAFTEKEANKIAENGSFICKWTRIHAIFVRNKLMPLGSRVLVKRMNNEQRYGDLIIPAGQQSTDQTLDCEIVNFGLPFKDLKRKIVGFKRGDKVRLTQWQENMIEVNIDEEFHLIVDEKDIMFRYE